VLRPRAGRTRDSAHAHKDLSDNIEGKRKTEPVVGVRAPLSKIVAGGTEAAERSNGAAASIPWSIATAAREDSCRVPDRHAPIYIRMIRRHHPVFRREAKRQPIARSLQIKHLL
jgi:hypothetical protein